MIFHRFWNPWCFSVVFFRGVLKNTPQRNTHVIKNDLKSRSVFFRARICRPKYECANTLLWHHRLSSSCHELSVQIFTNSTILESAGCSNCLPATSRSTSTILVVIKYSLAYTVKIREAISEDRNVLSGFHLWSVENLCISGSSSWIIDSRHSTNARNKIFTN